MNNLILICEYCGSQLTYGTIDDKIIVQECEYCKVDCAGCDSSFYDNEDDRYYEIEMLDGKIDELKQSIIDSKETNLEKIQTRYDFMYNI